MAESLGATQDLVRLYLDGIGQYPLLTADQEIELAQAVELGREVAAKYEVNQGAADIPAPADRRTIIAGEVAKTIFIQSNLRLVVSVAKRYPKIQGIELLDLVQEGNLGLEHAVDKFDWRKGFKFSTYATFWIRQSIGRALDQKASLIRLPGDRSQALRAARRYLDGDEELSPELADIDRLSHPTSLSTPSTDGGGTLEDMVQDIESRSPFSAAMSNIGSQALVGALGELSEESRQAVSLYFGVGGNEERSYARVGESMGLSTERARRLVNKALATMRKSRHLQVLGGATFD